MSILLTILIVAAAPDGSTGAPRAEAIDAYRADFDQGADQDFDGWPDGWTRQTGPGFPHYVGIKLADDETAEGGRCLRIDLDGGAAAAYTPPTPIGPNHSYLAEVRVKTERLEHDEAFLSITIADKDRRPLATRRSQGVTHADGWTTLTVGPVDATDSQARFAIVGLHLGPATGQDIKGAALFDSVWLGRLPHFTLSANRPLHLYQTGDEIELVCQGTGIEGNDMQVRFELIDALGGVVSVAERPLGGPIQGPPAAGPSAATGSATATVTWRPNVPDAGYYRARASLRTADQVVYARELSLAVVSPTTARPLTGEFGWTLPRGEGPVPLAALAPLLGQVGIHWVKFPLWHADQDYKRGAALAALCERLGAQRIEVVGMLAEPPVELRPQFGEAEHLTAADIFSAPVDAWYPSLELVMTPLSMKVRWWQLGTDADMSFVGDPRLAEKMARLQEHFNRLGPDVRLGFGWGWMHQLPQSENPAWRFLSLSATPPLTEDELAAYLDATREAGVPRWATVEPLARGHYTTEDRAAALVHSLVAAKVRGADAVFIPDPFDPEHGLLNPDGTPGELLLPWRTTALALTGASHLGSVPLPGGSPNQIFSRGGDAVMVVWNDVARDESLYLGEEAVQTDLWGRSRNLTGDAEQTVHVGPLPVIVTGINEPVLRLMMSARFERRQLPSVLGHAHSNPLVLGNFFPQGAGGRFRIVPPEGWQVRPEVGDFKLAAGEELVEPVQITFPYDADSGPQTVRVEFEITADRAYRFGIERTIEVGLGDVLIEASTRLDEAGELVVEQRITNTTDEPVSFRCDLFAPSRRRMRTQVWNLPRGTDVKRYVIPSGQDLVGQTLWIRGEEIRGPRVLSRRVTATR